MRWNQICLAAGLLSVAACTSSGTGPPSAPQPLNLTGTWSGNIVLQGTATRMTWMLTQTNASVTGPVLVLLPNGTVLLNGTLSGTLSGSTLTYTIAVSPGGIPAVPACSGQLAGSAVWASGANPTLTGSYAVTTATCSSAQIPSGNFTLTRQ
jgi:hypothetical protein